MIEIIRFAEPALDWCALCRACSLAGRKRCSPSAVGLCPTRLPAGPALQGPPRPESAGMSSARLERITTTAFEQEVAAKRAAGRWWRLGGGAQGQARCTREGLRLSARPQGPAEPDATRQRCFRIYSMTKPVRRGGAP